ncbi:MAG: glycine C-acetyltransferase, partial [Pseudomonadota bacterium]
ADNPALAEAAKEAMDAQGYGMASVRFICGTADLHEALEARLAACLGMEDAILFAACFDANGGVFEPLLGPEDAVISDALNHASIIDGIRLCKAKRFRYATNDMADLEAQLQAADATGARFKMIVTDGVFSMDGTLANLPEITRLAEKYDALTLVDDCHATGFMGPKGAGTHAHHGVDVTLLTGTLGKALGGAMGGYVAGPKPLISMLRQRARPYLFSNALPPSIVAASLKALELAEAGDDLRAQLFENTTYWRAGLTRLGFDLLPGEHPIIPVMLGDAKLAQDMAARLFELGVYVSAFFYPVVPKGQARIRTQMNAALTRADLDQGLNAFGQAGRELGVLPVVARKRMR